MARGMLAPVPTLGISAPGLNGEGRLALPFPSRSAGSSIPQWWRSYLRFHISSISLNPRT
jgi:hypothetical protein